MIIKSRTSSAKRSGKKRPDLGLALLLLCAALGTAFWAWHTRHAGASPRLPERAEAFLERQGLHPDTAVREGTLIIYQVLAGPSRLPAIRTALKREFGKTAVLKFAPPSEAGSVGLEIATIREGGEKVLLYFLRAPSSSPARKGLRGRSAGHPGRPALLAVCIDDLGYSAEVPAWFEKNRFPLHAAVLPHLPLSEETARRLHAAGVEVLCHLPMQPEDFPVHDPGPGAVLLGTSEEEVRQRAREAFASIPHLAGFNNHMGSAVTADPRCLRWIFAEARGPGLYFLDSRTCALSAAEDVGREMGVKVFRRHVFLDDVAEPAYIRGKLREACDLAREQGLAVAIGHPHPTTLGTLAAELPRLSSSIQLTRLSSLAGGR